MLHILCLGFLNIIGYISMH